MSRVRPPSVLPPDAPSALLILALLAVLFYSMSVLGPEGVAPALIPVP